MEAATTPETPEPTAETTQPEEEQRVPYERFQQANTKAKEAAQKAAKLEKTIADLQAQMEEREAAGLPELDQLKKRLEQAEKRAEEADRRASEMESQATNVRREQWVTAAASALNFHEPEDASRFVNLGEIESREDAERAVKAIAKAKKHLVKDEDKPLPGKVLNDGRRAEAAAPGGSAIDPNAEAESIRDALAAFRNNWHTV